jgi:hypothetical protein
MTFTIDTWFAITRAARGDLVLLKDGRTAEFHGWRLASFGPTLRLRFPDDPRLSDGWAPEAVVRVLGPRE